LGHWGVLAALDISNIGTLKVNTCKEAKASYRALKIQPQWVVTSGKQTNI